MKQTAHTQKPNNDHNKQTTTSSNSRPTNHGTTQDWCSRSVGKSGTLHEIAETGYQELQHIEMYPTKTIDNRESRVPQGFPTIPEQSTTSLTGHTSDYNSQPKPKSATTAITWSTRTKSKRIQKLVKPRHPPVNQTTSARKKIQTNYHYDSAAY